VRNIPFSVSFEKTAGLERRSADVNRNEGRWHYAGCPILFMKCKGFLIFPDLPRLRIEEENGLQGRTRGIVKQRGNELVASRRCGRRWQGWRRFRARLLCREGRRGEKQDAHGCFHACHALRTCGRTQLAWGEWIGVSPRIHTGGTVVSCDKLSHIGRPDN